MMFTVAMELTESQYQLTQPFLPPQRGKVSFSNLHVLKARLEVAEQGGKWRGVPQHVGNWHPILLPHEPLGHTWGVGSSLC